MRWGLLLVAWMFVVGYGVCLSIVAGYRLALTVVR